MDNTSEFISFFIAQEACDAGPSAHALNLQTPERAGPGLSRSSGCEQEEEEVEVDFLLYSPDRAPQIGGDENGPDNTDMTPEEEEEEVDVTGDEAE